MIFKTPKKIQICLQDKTLKSLIFYCFQFGENSAAKRCDSIAINTETKV